MYFIHLKFACKVTKNQRIIATFVPKYYDTLRRMTEIGLKHTSELTVTDAVTAFEMGPVDLPVLATPAMMAES